VADCEGILESLLTRGPADELDGASLAHLRGCVPCQRSAQRLAFLDEVLGATADVTPPPFGSLVRSARVAARGRRQRRAVRRALPVGVALAAAVALTAGVSHLEGRRAGRVAAARDAMVQPSTEGASCPERDGAPVAPRDSRSEAAAEALAREAWRQLRGGDRGGAKEGYRAALAMLPAHASPLWADNASAQLALLSENERGADGAAAWRRYLERFPNGVHAGIARRRLARSRTAER
jgi:hypothetical protein